MLENDSAKLEKTICDLKKELLQEQDKSKKLQDDLSAYTERESKMKQSMTSVAILLRHEFGIKIPLVRMLT